MPGTVLRPSENKNQTLPSQKAVSRALGVDVDVPITSDSTSSSQQGTDYCFYMSLLFFSC